MYLREIGRFPRLLPE
ncbi:hypothetical protein GNF10_30895 [Nostoc sp. UCD121]|uniref:Uncharacterized protein n=1 Tax=Scytonema hofmannii FACHB-248 TaxID=1842502 RepID=A0ABR8H012_9CYAN|nr:hypothetical protein [Nostoc sp. UCD120]MBC1280238.1 hypothetical protein [Nostoc sp. UCD121]MBC1296632.1 hypothetical protein [Nostoc sp. UCD122]MBD2608854.1 hypothetical protein [Scytonema hofmannii FACHB-248]MBX9253009.1 hypothetical protein [Desmonostoc muscorum CCALA 125]